MRSIKEEMEWVKRRNRILRDFEERAEQRGFIRVESDAFEPYIPFYENNERFSLDRLVKVNDLNGEVFLLKPDITTNIIKQVVMGMDQKDTLELYYLDFVYAYDRFGRIGSKRQFGVEVIGQKDVRADVGMVEFMAEIFRSYDFDYVIEIGDQRFLTLLFESLELEPRKAKDLKVALMKRNRADIEDIIAGRQRNGYRDVFDLVLAESRDLASVRRAIRACDEHEELLAAIDRLIAIEEAFDDPRIVFDLAMLNAYDYYNGPIYKAYIDGVHKDVARGGRYDTLTRTYGDMTPALGFSLDVDRLIKEVWKREKRT
ncbi:MAG: ATP phosphoribosyltransferase regulatory subunit [Acholeplasmataceae bacterium]